MKGLEFPIDLLARPSHGRCCIVVVKLPAGLAFISDSPSSRPLASAGDEHFEASCTFLSHSLTLGSSSRRGKRGNCLGSRISYTLGVLEGTLAAAAPCP